MTTIVENMTADHRRCDKIFAVAETSVAKDDWSSVEDQFKQLQQAMEHHFSMEEDVLFPAYEERTGQTMGPTQVMRMEHKQMRQLFSNMSQAVDKQDRDGYLGMAETLMIIMQQHNMKEEQMFYRMADQVLGGDVDEILQKMESIQSN
jgi:hemerythrin-like domain-containing protein